MKKDYESPSIEVMEIEIEDAVLSSSGSSGGGSSSSDGVRNMSTGTRW